MALDELLISTGVDSLIKLVHEKGKIEIADASKELRMPKQTIEDWAHVLEEEGIVRIEYKLTKMFLAWASMNPEEFQKATREVASRKTETEEKIEKLISTVEKSGSELSELKADLNLMKKKSDLTLETIEGEGKEIRSMAEDIDRLVSQKEKRITAFKKELNSLHSEMETLMETQAKLSGGKKGGKEETPIQLEQLRKAEEKMEGQIKEFQESYAELEAQIAQAQQTIHADKTLDEIGHLKSSIADLQFAKAELLKTIESLRDETKQISSEINGMQEKIAALELRKVSVSNPKKLLTQLDEAAYNARQERDTTLAELQKSLEMVRKQMQSFSQLQYQYQTLNARVASLQSSYNKETEEVEQFLGALESAYKKYTKDISSLSGALDDEKKRYEQMQQRAKHIEMVLGQIDTLKQEGDSLAIKLKGVLKEAQVVSMMGGGAGTGGASGAGAPPGGWGGGAAMKKGAAPSAPQMPPELVQKINLTAAEEEEFERKREELRGLIRRMWEEDRSS